MAFHLMQEFPPNTCGAACFFCGSIRRTPDEPVIATDLDLEFEGLVALCVQCATELGRLVNLSESEDEQIESLLRTCAELELEAQAASEKLSRVLDTIQLVQADAE